MSLTETVDDDDGRPPAQADHTGLPKWPGSGAQRVLMGVDRVSMVVIVAAMVGMSAIVVLQVFFRHVLSSSIDSADELSRLLFVWAMFLALPHGVKYGVHVGIDLFVAYLSASRREFVFRLTSVAGALLMGVVFVAAWIATGEKWQQLMPTLPITSAVFYISVLISALHSAAHLLLHAWGGSAIWGGRRL
ncbi:TRAP transporter small permease subunit [Pusillimonas sp. TS35]|uniref:TRAP transporter small permease n=1 Tax=Paracandidimonas lactea TaxID=2895524 RepID=UPI001370A9E1|nr:TRAP transporter small permease [Paracandidimonas lactea]MYN14786.1 TRAP transporter small permease subunit [Pusillimonas sp. TS35]